ncbi:helix-turn-helix domain-containing protein [Bacteroides sp. 51]|uniref:helix-turn-helix domain-containing protein n=1 Tax=Bacteroides sp. 51 TaxID=2302938 RepID=UPI0013D334B5|nr:helix-turn-helix domain-containing protein [Bacteroides sp. 51]NDV84450.1 AraC family transcriptional regulator [Bacteroides sp. 51]
MQSFRTIKPRPELAPYIKHYWILQDDATLPVSERIFPVGSVQMVFHKGKQLFSLTEKELQPQSLVCGHTIGFSDVITTGDLNMITVVFHPHAAKIFFRLPMNEFRGRHVSVCDTNDILLSDLAKRVADTPDNDTCIQYIESFLMQRLATYTSYHLQRLSATIDEIGRQTQTTVTKLSDIACLSSKQFNRVFIDHVGTTPKEFMRIVRMQRALYTMQQQPAIDFAQLAYTCGFSDQSHLIKEFKLFSGYTPTEYLAVCAPYSDYFSVG